MIDIRLLRPTNLLYEALEQPFIEKGKRTNEKKITCPLCGYHSNEMVEWKISAKFTDLDIFAEKENITHLCPACYYALSNIRGLHKAYLLTLNGGLQILQFDDQDDKKVDIGIPRVISRYFLMDLLINPPENEPWILMLQSKMNPQHSLMKARVNYGYSETIWVSDGATPYAIPKTDLKNLLNALEIIKKSDSLYPYLFEDKTPRKDHKEHSIWEKVEPIIVKHRHSHYLSFLYDRIIPPKKYMLEKTIRMKGEKNND